MGDVPGDDEFITAQAFVTVTNDLELAPGGGGRRLRDGLTQHLVTLSRELRKERLYNQHSPHVIWVPYEGRERVRLRGMAANGLAIAMISWRTMRPVNTQVHKYQVWKTLLRRLGREMEVWEVPVQQAQVPADEYYMTGPEFLNEINRQELANGHRLNDNVIKDLQDLGREGRRDVLQSDDEDATWVPHKGRQRVRHQQQ